MELSFIIGFGIIGCQPKAESPIETYANGRFGFCVQYPSDLLRPMGESENGDGQSFNSQDQQLTVRAFGYHDLGEPLSVEMAQRIEWWENDDLEMELFEQASTDTSYLVSGARNGYLFEQRALHRHGMFWFIEREYSESVDDKVLQASSKMLETFPNCP